jgi:RNA polymerase sigma-70 factor (ECF subfamily)
MSPDDLAAQLERLHRAAFGWALSCCAWDRSAAEDVLQASYLKILDGRARFAGRSSFRTWVFGVIRRTAQEERRRAALGRWLPLARLVFGAGGGGGADGRPGADAVLARADETARLIGALARLPARQRDVLHLVFYEDLTIAEAAAVLGVALGTARAHYERGKAALRGVLEELEEKDR